MEVFTCCVAFRFTLLVLCYFILSIHYPLEERERERGNISLSQLPFPFLLFLHSFFFFSFSFSFALCFYLCSFVLPSSRKLCSRPDQFVQTLSQSLLSSFQTPPNSCQAGNTVHIGMISITRIHLMTASQLKFELELKPLRCLGCRT